MAQLPAAPGGQPDQKAAVASKKPGKPGGARGLGAPSKSGSGGSKGTVAGKARGMTLLLRMQSGGGKAQCKK